MKQEEDQSGRGLSHDVTVCIRSPYTSKHPNKGRRALAHAYGNNNTTVTTFHDHGVWQLEYNIHHHTGFTYAISRSVSHAIISRTTPSLRGDPVDILSWVFDVACFTVNAVLSVDL